MSGWLNVLGKVLVGVVGVTVVAVLANPTPSHAGSPSPPAPSVLRRNLHRLRAALRQPAAPGVRRRVAVLGQPGAGKSSLLRKVSDMRMVPLPEVGIHTDATDWSCDLAVSLLARWADLEVADVPGYDTAQHPADVMQSEFPFEGFDAFVWVLNGKLRAADQAMVAQLLRSGKPLYVVRSFADGLTEAERTAVCLDVGSRLGLAAATPLLLLSNRTGEGVATLRQWLLAL